MKNYYRVYFYTNPTWFVVAKNRKDVENFIYKKCRLGINTSPDLITRSSKKEAVESWETSSAHFPVVIIDTPKRRKMYEYLCNSHRSV
jgi:hypothetical protein